MPAASGSKTGFRQRNHTRGGVQTGMSHQVMMDGGDDYPQPPSHYLGQPTGQAMSEGQFQPRVDPRHSNQDEDSVNLVEQHHNT